MPNTPPFLCLLCQELRPWKGFSLEPMIFLFIFYYNNGITQKGFYTPWQSPHNWMLELGSSKEISTTHSPYISLSIHNILSLLTDVMVFVNCHWPNSITWWKGRSEWGPRYDIQSRSRFTDEHTLTDLFSASWQRSRIYVVILYPPLPRLADILTFCKE